MKGKLDAVYDGRSKTTVNTQLSLNPNEIQGENLGR